MSREAIELLRRCCPVGDEFFNGDFLRRGVIRINSRPAASAYD
jgi:hypothetical protein